VVVHLATCGTSNDDTVRRTTGASALGRSRILEIVIVIVTYVVFIEVELIRGRMGCEDFAIIRGINQSDRA
jgi:hypothetical protein